jgi:protein subunit release factor A
VTDHRLNLTTYNLIGFMSGALLDDFIDELATRDEAERLATLGEETVTANSE